MAKQRALLGGKLLNPCDYLAAVELTGDLTLTVASVQHEKLFREGLREAEIKPTLSFKESPKKLVLSARENEDIMCRLYGSVAEEWVGKPVTLYATTTRLGRDTVPCIRIRDRAPAPATIGDKNAEKILAKLQAKNSDVSELMAHLEPVPDTDQIAQWPKSLVPQIQTFLSSNQQKEGE